MYNRADVGGGELGWGPVWGRCCRLGGGKLAEGSHRRGKRKGEGEEQACKLCDDYPQTQGPSVLHPTQADGRDWGGELCFRTGVRGGKRTRKSREEAYRGCRRGKERQTGDTRS